jgi:hypothetical protein
MGNYATKYRRAVTSGGSDFCIEVLQLHLLPPHIVPKSAKAGGFILLTSFVIEVIWRRSGKSRWNLDNETYGFQSVCAPRLNLSHGGSPFWATTTTMANQYIGDETVREAMAATRQSRVMAEVT